MKHREKLADEAVKKYKYFVSYFHGDVNILSFGRCDVYSDEKIRGCDGLIPVEHLIAEDHQIEGVSIIGFQYIGRVKISPGKTWTAYAQKPDNHPEQGGEKGAEG